VGKPIVEAGEAHGFDPGVAELTEAFFKGSEEEKLEAGSRLVDDFRERYLYLGWLGFQGGRYVREPYGVERACDFFKKLGEGYTAAFEFFPEVLDDTKGHIFGEDPFLVSCVSGGLGDRLFYPTGFVVGDLAMAEVE